MRTCRRTLLLLIVAGCCAMNGLAAERPKNGAVSKPATDQVTLRSGIRLRGMLFETGGESTTLLVSSSWLKTTNAKLLESARAKTAANHTAALERLIERLNAEMAREHPAPLANFLKQQLESAREELNDAEKSPLEFVWLTFTPRELERTEPTTLEQRQLLAWSWSEKLERPEMREAEDLQKELKARAVVPVQWPITLIERLPARDQSDQEWAARLAITEYAHSKPLDFQGTGDVLARAGKEVQAAEMGQLLVEILRGQLQSQLGDLLGDAKPVKRATDNAARAESLNKAIQTAESEKRTGFRVTRLELAGDFQQVTVTTQFMARLADGSWRTVFQHTERTDAKQARPEIEKRIQDDPQVKQVLELTRQLGLTAEGQIQQAIRFGAATMTAQQACDREFAAFRDIYLSSLARPPLTINKPKSE